jgi:transposase InsO family protein
MGNAQRNTLGARREALTARAYWRWKSRGRPGRPRVSRELRELIQRMSKENPLWGAPRIHGELLKLGFEIAESTVSKYMIRRRGPPSQTWRTFLRNHAHAIAAIDLCVVPTLTFECLFAFLVVGHGRRQLLWFAVTRHPTAEWLAQQIVEAFPWGSAPTYLLRDNDGAYGQAFTSRIRAMGIRDRPISRRAPWQNPYVERLIGTLRRECLDHGVPRTYRRRGRCGAVQEMGEGPSYPAIRSRMQTAASCCR